MARGNEALAKDRLNQLDGHDISELRTDKELASEHSDKVVDERAGEIRKELLERMTRDKGVISEDETKDWTHKVDDSIHDLSRLRSVKHDFEEHWRQSVELRKKFEGRVGSADKEGMLRRGEQEQLFESFSDSGLKAKEKALQELEKELTSRQAELKKFVKLEKKVQQKRRDSLEGAENYDEKLKVLESAEKENQNYQKYREVFKKHADKIGKKTTAEYLEWFLTLSENEQHSALSKAEKEDIEPRVELFNIHKELPKEHQTPDFKEWGLNRREQYLGEVERGMTRKHRKLLREKAEGVFCKESIQLCEKAFNQNGNKLGERLKHKVMFLEALPGQIKAEKKLWDKFEKFDPEVQDVLTDKFKDSDFEKKQEILRTDAPKIADKYGKLLNRINNKLDPHIAESIRDKFEEAGTIDKKTEAILEGEKFQKSKDRYFAKWAKNADAFKSDPAVYEKWYAENVNSLEAAKKAETQLDSMVTARKQISKATSKLPAHLRDRMNADQPLADREKSIRKLQDVARFYQSAIPFLIQNAEVAEKNDDSNLAFNFYLQALKMDPDSQDLQTLVAALRQKGAEPSITPSSALDQAETDNLLEQVDNMNEIETDAEDLARKQVLLTLSKKHHEQSGAAGSTTTARAQKSIRNLSEEDQGLGEAVIEQHSDTHTIDETGAIRRKKQVKLEGSQEKQTEDQLEQFFNEKQQKGEASQSGLSEVAFTDTSGREVELSTAEKALHEQTEKLAKNRRNKFFSLAQTKAGLTEQQMKAVQESYATAHKDDELLETEMERMAA
jgi:hypothetical protein